jgi:hypothetical protein
VRFRRYLFVILMISSSTSGILESLWRVFLLTYHGALNTNRNVFDCILCMICVFEGLAQPHSIDIFTKLLYCLGVRGSTVG